MPIDTSLRKVLVIGSGPIVIGQAAEFDYSGSQACRSLREEGLEVVLINSNPATIMTDPETADRVYIEPLTVEFAERVIAQERPDGLLPTLGGQTGLNLATELAVRGILDKYGVRLLGTPLTAIQAAEDREKFRDLMRQIGEPVPESWIVESMGELRRVAEIAPYPCIVRPAYTLGGTGGGIARTPDELLEIGARGLELSMRHQILVERSLLGWKEIEYEVMRDGADNAIVVCNMENLDPMGVHTGDSMVVAPSQTLSDFEYQLLRTASLRIIRALGIQGGCNVQLALNPHGSDYYVIEVNPRVSRSSALASKATGYPIARIAAKIAIGLRLDEIRNPITGTSAAFEPALDYCVVKLPRFPFDKFPTGDRTLGTQMKATGEVMAIDRTFEGALMKAVRGLEVGVSDLRYPPAARLSPMELETLIETPNDMRLFYLAEAFRRGWLVEEVHALSKVDPWFLHKIKHLVEMEQELIERSGELRQLLLVASASPPTNPASVASASSPTNPASVASASPPTNPASVASASPPTSRPQDADAMPYFPSFTEIVQLSGARLPHWIAENAVYFVTFRLADSLPREVLQRYIRERNELVRQSVASLKRLTLPQRQQLRWLLSERFDALLHARHGKCILGNQESAQIVADALKYFHQQRYILWGWCVMPNHVHVVVQPLPGYSLSQILHSWKSYTAHQLVRRKLATPPVWEKDYFQRLIRNQDEFERVFAYTLLNPEWTLLRRSVGVPADEAQPRSVGVPADECAFHSVGVPADELHSPPPTYATILSGGVQRGWWDAQASCLREGLPEWLMEWFVGGTPTLRAGEAVVSGTLTLRAGEAVVSGTLTLRAGEAVVGGDADATYRLLRRAKEWQFSDKFLSQITGLSEAQVRAGRKALGILPAFKMVDTCAGEFEARTPYFYSTYHGVSDRPAPQHPRKALVLGSGPIRIGQGIEFDYSAVHAVKTLRSLGYYAMILNNNPETVSTDFDISDALYFDPITTEDVLNVLEYEAALTPNPSPTAWERGVNPPLSHGVGEGGQGGEGYSIPVLVQFGGQTAINLVKSLQAFGVQLLGTPPESIDIAEDRRRFDALLEELGVPRPPGRAVLTLEDALATAHSVGYPVLVRPSYVLGGRAMEIVRTDAELETYWHSAVLAFPDAPVLVDKYIEGKEAEVDLIGDSENFLIPAIMEHIERAGVHSGDSMTVVPPQTLSESEQAQIRDYALRLAKALRVCGLVNMQFVVQDGKVYVIEVNPRASRTVPYLSKITNVPMVQLAVAAQVGSPSPLTEQSSEVSKIAVKAPVFSSLKLKQVEVALGPEMRSTGEVMGIDKTYAAALYKAMVAAGIQIPRKGNVLLTLADKDKVEGVALARAFHEKGFQLYATAGTARALQEAGLPVQVVPKIGQGKPDLLDYITGKRVQLLVNTPSPDRRAEQQGLLIRRAAVETGIPCLTALDTAWALLHALEAGEFEVAPIAHSGQILPIQWAESAH